MSAHWSCTVVTLPVSGITWLRQWSPLHARYFTFVGLAPADRSDIFNSANEGTPVDVQVWGIA